MSMNNGRQVKQNMFRHSDMSQVRKQTHHMFFRDIQLIKGHYYFEFLFLHEQVILPLHEQVKSPAQGSSYSLQIPSFLHGWLELRKSH